jgi:hypothetical protein
MLDGLLEGRGLHEAGVLMVRGEAGLGKTALKYAIEAASDLMVVRAAGPYADTRELRRGSGGDLAR